MKQYRISDKDFWHQIHADFKDSGGAYKLICKQNGKVKPVSRLLGIDRYGVLYIGKATNYTNRVVGLKKTLDPSMKSTPHICGRRYNKNAKIREQFPFEDLFIQLIRDDSPEELERKLIDSYFDEFGEVPPLNANG